jgi:ATP-dependent Clp protease protease subunit
VHLAHNFNFKEKENKMGGMPYVIERGPKNEERTYDLPSRMLKDRIIFVRGVFDQSMADSVVAQLLFLETSDPEEDIRMYINSPGGEISSMYAIYDTMNYIKPAITTIAMGTCASAASFILAAGTKGKRFALPNCEVMIHELSGGTGGKFNEIKNAYEHTIKLYEKMAKHYVEFTGQKLSKIKQDMQRDFFMTSEEAKEYGLIDEVLYKRI